MDGHIAESSDAMNIAQDSNSISGDDFKSAMRHLSAAVTLITSEDAGVKVGLTATAVCSLSANPPRLLACVGASCSAHDGIIRSGRFAVNVLRSEQVDLARRFAEHPKESRFEQGRWHAGPTGAPLLSDALVVFDCLIDRVINAGSHSVLWGLIAEARSFEGEPLLYGNASYGSLSRLGH